MIKNKRGDPSIVIFVILMLFITLGVILTFFISSKKVEAHIDDAFLMKNQIYQKNLAEFYIYELSERATVKTFKEMAENADYLDPVTYNSDRELIFTSLKNNIGEEFKNRFSENLKKEFSKEEFKEDYMGFIKNKINSGDFKLEYGEFVMSLEISGIEINPPENSGKKNLIFYSLQDLSINTKIEHFGLTSFENIYKVKESCKNFQSVAEIKMCLENELENFNINTLEKTGVNDERYYLISLTSKRQYLIDDSLQKINLGFVMR